MKKVRYPAEISKPVILVRSEGFAVPDPKSTSGQKKIQDANEEMIRLRDEAIVQKLHLLMDHYKIQNKEDWFVLARALALDHVDGLERAVDQLHTFRTTTPSDPGAFSGPVRFNKKSSGRSTKWPIERLLALHEAVETEKTKNELSTDVAALKRVARRSEWRRPASHRGTSQQWIETLEARNQEAKSFRRDVPKQLKMLEEIARQLIQKNSGNSAPP